MSRDLGTDDLTLCARLDAAAPLAPGFYRRGAARVARALLGKVLVTRLVDGRLLAGMVVETEAYLGAADPASHAYRGETERNRVMFGEGGVCYVYLSYGMHYCMNVVTGPAGRAEAVLLRGVEPLVNLPLMAGRRGLDPRAGASKLRAVSNGPGKLTQALGIGPAQNGWRFDRPDFKLVDLGTRVAAARVGTSGRIGITKAVDEPLRFFLVGSPYVGRPPAGERTAP